MKTSNICSWSFVCRFLMPLVKKEKAVPYVATCDGNVLTRKPLLSTLRENEICFIFFFANFFYLVSFQHLEPSVNHGSATFTCVDFHWLISTVGEKVRQRKEAASFHVNIVPRYSTSDWPSLSSDDTQANGTKSSTSDMRPLSWWVYGRKRMLNIL